MHVQILLHTASKLVSKVILSTSSVKLAKLIQQTLSFNNYLADPNLSFSMFDHQFALTTLAKLDAGVMEAITKGPAFGDGKLLHAYVLW